MSRSAGRDVSGVTVTLEPGLTVSGRVVFDGKTLTPPELPRVNISMRVPPSATGVSLGVPDEPGDAGRHVRLSRRHPRSVSSRLDQCQRRPGRCRAPRWQLRSARRSKDATSWIHRSTIGPGADVSDLVLTFTDQVAELSGALVDGAGRPAPEYYVFVFPTDKTQWFQGARRMRPPSRPASDGKYRLPGLPPGRVLRRGPDRIRAVRHL